MTNLIRKVKPIWLILMPRSLHQTSSLLADQHIKVKLHVVPQQLPGEGHHLVVEHGLLHLHAQVQWWPHDLTNVLHVLVLPLHMTAQVMSVLVSIHSTSHYVFIEVWIWPQFLFCQHILWIKNQSSISIDQILPYLWPGTLFSLDQVSVVVMCSLWIVMNGDCSNLVFNSVMYHVMYYKAKYFLWF